MNETRYRRRCASARQLLLRLTPEIHRLLEHAGKWSECKELPCEDAWKWLAMEEFEMRQGT